jgi:tetratricopeptide (TPR) repeat protein
MNSHEIRDLARDLLTHTAQLEELDEEARALVGGADDAAVAAVRLLQHLPSPKRGDVDEARSQARLKGAAAYFAGDLASARSIYRRVPGSANPNLFADLFQLGDLRGADLDEVARFVLELAPDHLESLKVRAATAINDGRPADGVPLLKRAVEIDPGYGSAWYNLACAYARLGEKPAMLEALRTAIRQDAARYDDYAKAAWNDADFKAFRKDSDFVALVRPGTRVPGAEKLSSLVEDGSFDRALVEVARLMAATPPHAAALAKIARSAAMEVADDLQEHDDENADEYRFGGAAAYRALAKALKAVKSGDTKSIEAYAALLPSKSAARGARPGKAAQVTKKPVKKAVRKPAAKAAKKAVRKPVKKAVSKPAKATR